MNGSDFVQGESCFLRKTDTKECLCESQISCGVTAEVLDALTTGSKCITSTTLSHSCEYNGSHDIYEMGKLNGRYRLL